MMPPHLPRATYRLQLTPSFGFDQAAAIVPYLKALGISHLYASPFLKARAGSLHGYDVVDFNALNPELGGEKAFRRLVHALAGAELGLILDFVPNHVAVHHHDNACWLDVLEWGPASPHARAFDIDWKAQDGRVLLPILGCAYGQALAQGDIALRYDRREGGFAAWYFDHKLPIRPRDYGAILHEVVAPVQSTAPAARALSDLAARFDGKLGRGDAQNFKAELGSIDGGAQLIEARLETLQATSAWPTRLHCLLERQLYRLAHWSLAQSDLNYRRFFDISSLAGLRVEEPATFEALHKLVGRLIADGSLQGLRLDHIDGLADPAQYCQQLHDLARARQPEFYLVMEKILAEGEAVPRFPGVSGTTGYEWLNLISCLLLDRRGLAVLDQTWRDFSGVCAEFEDILRAAKRHVLEHVLASEFGALVRLLTRIAAGHYGTRDFSAAQISTALALVVIEFPIYRTYVTASGPSAQDRAIIAQAIEAARAQWSPPQANIFDFLRDALTLDLVARAIPRHSRARVCRFAARLQQLTGPLMAKSLEDTALYRHHRLLALNEVGGSPQADELSIEEFHRRMQARSAAWPHGLTATATHDTKRGEDARARLAALSEVAQDWTKSVRAWQQHNAHLVRSRGASRIPSAAHEYMLYQAMLGAWPLTAPGGDFVERIEAYALKAAREGKEQTSWLAPDRDYESGLADFVRAILDPAVSPAFLESFSAFAQRLALMGALNSLLQVTLKATMPGIPDFYQGTEFWDLSLVDPDNRRPVDFAPRAQALRAAGPDWLAFARNWRDGGIKLALTAGLLAARRAHPNVFVGEYRPLEVAGRHREEIVAFARCDGTDAVLVVAARLFGRSSQHGRCWPPQDAWDAVVSLGGFSPARNLLTDQPTPRGSKLAVRDLFDVLPIALLQAERVQAA
jgi:(1->4)-alpha-D-glucan 1-alpha-D-glucosylmutase